jgi:hypothetical protein
VCVWREGNGTQTRVWRRRVEENGLRSFGTGCYYEPVLNRKKKCKNVRNNKKQKCSERFTEVIRFWALIAPAELRPSSVYVSVSYPLRLFPLSAPIYFTAASIADRFRPAPASPHAAEQPTRHLLPLLSRFRGAEQTIRCTTTNSGRPRSRLAGAASGSRSVAPTRRPALALNAALPPAARLPHVALPSARPLGLGRGDGRRLPARRLRRDQRRH